MLVLSLFPGFGLLDYAFELEGFTVVRGPDVLWGGDVRRFHVPPGVFNGVIGGPPCQPHSKATNILDTSTAVDLVPEFIRIAGAALVDDGTNRDRFVVMENVEGLARHRLPAGWNACRLRDWDCGGLTNRKRYFWTWPTFIMDPVPRAGEPEYSVMASTGKRGGSNYVTDKGFLPGNLPIEYYEGLQGVPEGYTRELIRAGGSRQLAIHALGNGVPVAMGRYIARAIRQDIEQKRAARHD